MSAHDHKKSHLENWWDGVEGFHVWLCKGCGCVLDLEQENCDHCNPIRAEKLAHMQAVYDQFQMRKDWDWYQAEQELRKKPAEISITAGTNRQDDTFTPQNTAKNNNTTPTNGELTTGGLDWLEVQVFGHNGENQFHEIARLFDAAQKSARDNPASGGIIEYRGHVIRVKAAGAKMGNAYAPWIIECDGIVYRIGSSFTFKPKRANVSVQIGSVPLMAHGHVAMWALAEKFLVDLGYRVITTRVSRVDVCVDLADQPVSEFLEAHDAAQAVYRVQDWCVYRSRDRVTGLESRSTGCRLRIYDKAQELRKKPNELKQRLLEAKRWGRPCEIAARIEYQVRREVLRTEHSVDTVADLFKALPAMCVWLTTDWYRIVEGLTNRNHTERHQASPLWQKVCEAFTRWVGEKLTDRIERTTCSLNPEPLIKQAFGCLFKALALVGDLPETREACLSLINDVATGFIADTAVDQIAYKRKILEMTYPQARAIARAAAVPF